MHTYIYTHEERKKIGIAALVFISVTNHKDIFIIFFHLPLPTSSFLCPQKEPQLVTILYLVR